MVVIPIMILVGRLAYTSDSTATIQQLTFQNGYAAYLGGAIHSTNHYGVSKLIVISLHHMHIMVELFQIYME
jgi:predicted outer membrane repeat protein